MDCHRNSKQDGAGLVLDTAGVGLGVLALTPAGEAVNAGVYAGAGVGLGSLSILNAGFAAPHDGTPGHAGTFTTLGVSVAGVNASAIGVVPPGASNFLKALPVIGLGISLFGAAVDLGSAAKDLLDCTNGK